MILDATLETLDPVFSSMHSNMEMGTEALRLRTVVNPSNFHEAPLWVIELLLFFSGGKHTHSLRIVGGDDGCGRGIFDVNVPCTCTQLMLRCMGGWGAILGAACCPFICCRLPWFAAASAFSLRKTNLSSKGSFGRVKGWTFQGLCPCQPAVQMRVWTFRSRDGAAFFELFAQLGAPTWCESSQKSFPAPLRLCVAVWQSGAKCQAILVGNSTRQNVVVTSLDGFGTWWSVACGMACVEKFLAQQHLERRRAFGFWVQLHLSAIESWLLQSVAKKDSPPRDSSCPHKIVEACVGVKYFESQALWTRGRKRSFSVAGPVKQICVGKPSILAILVFWCFFSQCGKVLFSVISLG